MVFSELSVGVLLAGVAGGILGAAIGALQSLSLAGIAIVAGEVLTALFGAEATTFDVFGTGAAPLDAVGITATLGFGPVLGPHVAFAGGVAAAAYAGRKQTFDTTFRYHQAKQVAKPLGKNPKALVVGGVFGLFGVLVARLASGLPIPLDPIALAVVLSAVVHRLAFGYPLLGRLRDSERSIFDMSPFETAQYWGDDDHDTSHGIGGRHVVEPWQPKYCEWQTVTGIGAGAGVAAGILALGTGSAFLAFGLSLASLLVRVAGRYELPVTHHMVLPAGIAALAIDANPVIALFVAGAFGLFGALLGEFAQRVCYAHGDTHFDPSFVSILLTSLLLAILGAVEMLDSGVVPYP